MIIPSSTTYVTSPAGKNYIDTYNDTNQDMTFFCGRTALIRVMP